MNSPKKHKKILISPTAFKGTLSPWQAAEAMAMAVKRLWPTSHVTLLPLADGGDGTCEVLVRYYQGQIFRTRATGPLLKKVNAFWGLIKLPSPVSKRIAVIEVAEASGLKHIRGKNKIREASSKGTGELIQHALDAGCQRILVGVGGTACSDGGAGLLYALGARFFDQQGQELDPTPAQLIHMTHCDVSKLDPRLKKTHIDVLCDVINPLLGKNGSAAVFGPQKGATPGDISFLEKFFEHWVTFARYKTHEKPGAGAAGGIAFGLSGFLGARLIPGTPYIMKTVQWKKAAKKSDLILTGEGKIDRTSFSGKVVGEVTSQSRRGLVYAVCGRTTLPQHEWHKHNIQQLVIMGKTGLAHPTQAIKHAIKKLRTAL